MEGYTPKQHTKRARKWSTNLKNLSSGLEEEDEKSSATRTDVLSVCKYINNSFNLNYSSPVRNIKRKNLYLLIALSSSDASC